MKPQSNFQLMTSFQVAPYWKSLENFTGSRVISVFLTPNTPIMRNVGRWISYDFIPRFNAPQAVNSALPSLRCMSLKINCVWWIIAITAHVIVETVRFKPHVTDEELHFWNRGWKNLRRTVWCLVRIDVENCWTDRNLCIGSTHSTRSTQSTHSKHSIQCTGLLACSRNCSHVALCMK